MTIHRTNSMLYWSAALLAACAVVSLWGLIAPLDRDAAIGSTAASPTSIIASVAKPNETQRTLLASLEPVLSRPLRAASSATPAPHAKQTVVAAPPAAAPGIALVGTIGDSLVMLRTPDGEVAVKAVGEQFDGAEIVAIRPSQVDLKMGGKIQTLQRIKEATTP